MIRKFRGHLVNKTRDSRYLIYQTGSVITIYLSKGNTLDYYDGKINDEKYIMNIWSLSELEKFIKSKEEEDYTYIGI